MWLEFRHHSWVVYICLFMSSVILSHILQASQNMNHQYIKPTLRISWWRIIRGKNRKLPHSATSELLLEIKRGNRRVKQRRSLNSRLMVPWMCTEITDRINQACNSTTHRWPVIHLNTANLAYELPHDLHKYKYSNGARKRALKQWHLKGISSMVTHSACDSERFGWFLGFYIQMALSIFLEHFGR